MGFVLDWQKKLGYKSDPFVAAPARKAHDYIVGYEAERERLNLFVIKQERYGIITGSSGVGKSTLLQWLAEELSGHVFKLRLLTITDSKILAKGTRFRDHLLHKVLNPLERYGTKPHEELKGEALDDFIIEKLSKRRVVLLVDNANDLSPESFKLLKRIHVECPRLQLVLVLERVLKAHEEIDKASVRLSLEGLGRPVLRDLIARRITLAQGYKTFPFDEKELNALCDKAKKNPAKLLTITRERAIELSLKVQGPPKPVSEVKPAPRPTLSAKKGEGKASHNKTATKEASGAPQKKKGFGWFSIKVLSEEEAAKEAKSAKKERKALEREALDPELVKESYSEEAALLNELVNSASDAPAGEKGVKGEGKGKVSEEVNDIVESLIEEIGEENVDKKR